MFTMEVYSVIIGSGTTQGLLGTSAAALALNYCCFRPIIGWLQVVEGGRKYPLVSCQQSVCGVKV